MMAARDAYWDSLKYVLIAFVVLGHCIELYYPDKSINRAVYNTIYLFHMPLFVFISGRFSHLKDRYKYKKSILKLFETLIIFQIINSFVIPLITDEEILWKHLIVPNWILWYLMSLIWWRLLIIITPPSWLKTQKRRIVVGSFLVSILGGFIPVGHPLEIQRTLAFLPFFMLGYYSTDINVKESIKRIPVWLADCFPILVFLIFYFFLNYDLTWLLSAGQHYWEQNPPMHVRIASRVIYLPFAMLTCVMILRLVKSNKFLARLGEASLFIYIFHACILDIIKMLIRLEVFNATPVSVYLYFIMVLLVVTILSKVILLRKTLNPVSCLYAQRNKTSF